MSNGSIRTFKSQVARDRFEKVARAIKHGWKPTRQLLKKNERGHKKIMAKKKRKKKRK